MTTDETTYVDRIKGYTGINENDPYTEELAIEVLGNFIFPKTAYTSVIDGQENPSIIITNTSFISNVRQLKMNLANWLFSHDEELEKLEEIRGFNSETFDKINNAAFKKLLKLSISSFLEGIENSNINTLIIDGDKIPARLKGTAFLQELERKIKDGRYFNNDISLEDIKNQTPESRYFYKLSDR